LTARPPGPRRALRVVIDSTGDSVTAAGKLVQTLDQADVLVCVSQRCRQESVERLKSLGIQVFQTSSFPHVDIRAVLHELGRRKCTHVLLEAGPHLLGSFFDAGLVDEIHTFVAPKLIGGSEALAAVGGQGLARIPTAANLTSMRTVTIGEDILIEADVSRNAPSTDLQPA